MTSLFGFLHGLLEGAHRMGPHLIEVCAKARHAFRVQLIEPARSSFAVHHQPRILEHLEVLRYGRSAYRHDACQFVDGDRAAGEPLEDGHACGIAQCFQAGL